jgi:hypothetical protein
MKFPLLGYIASCSYLLPVIVGIRYRKQLSKEDKLFLLYVIIAAIQIIIENVLAEYKIANLGVSNYYRIIEVIFISVIYTQFAKRYTFDRFYSIIGFIFCVMWMYNFFFEYEHEIIPNIMASITRIALIIMSLKILFLFLTDYQSTIYNSSFYWFSFGLLLYNISTIALMALANEIYRIAPNYFLFAWNINWGMAILMNLMYVKGFMCK